MVDNLRLIMDHQQRQHHERSTQLTPKQLGFKWGYENPNFNAPPPNPYPLRSVERRQWHEGRALGRRLGLVHQQQFEKELSQCA